MKRIHPYNPDDYDDSWDRLWHVVDKDETTDASWYDWGEEWDDWIEHPDADAYDDDDDSYSKKKKDIHRMDLHDFGVELDDDDLAELEDDEE